MTRGRSAFVVLTGAARRLRDDALTIYYAARDPRTPWPVRGLALIIAAYAISPIDLIPDFIPVLGYLDELVLLPLGIWLLLRLVPGEVIADGRRWAAGVGERPVSRPAAVVIIGIWIAALAAIAGWCLRALPA